MTKSKYCIVVVKESEHIWEKCAGSLKEIKKHKKTALAKFRKGGIVSDGFVEIRELGDFEYGDFDTLEVWYPDDIYTEKDYKKAGM